MTRALIAIALVACTKAGGFPCTTDEVCTRGGEMGICADGFCAFADTGCQSGYKYEPSAGDGLAGTCTTPTVSCGGFGEACCDAVQACSDGAYCDSSRTCSTCIAQLGLGRRFSCVLKDDHSVWCLGDNGSGQLGTGAAGPPSPEAKQVRDSTFSAVTDATAIATGREHACAIRGGNVWCWGANENGQLGNGVTVPPPPMPPPQPSPFAVKVITMSGQPLTNAVAIHLGDHHSCAIDDTGSVWCWGWNQAGQLGDGCQQPPAPMVCPCPAGCPTARGRASQVTVSVNGAVFGGAVDIMTGERHNCIHKAGDELWCWGNGGGTLLDGTGAGHVNPIKVGSAPNVATGNWHSCMINGDSTVSCAGWNGHARLGIGSGTGYSGGNYGALQTVLVAPMGSPFTGATKIAAGGETCVITADTHVWCWSDDSYGETGTGQSVTVPAPVRLLDGTPLSGITDLVAQYAHVCGKTMAGQWVCWGRNNQGELGDSSFVNHGFPTPYGLTCP